MFWTTEFPICLHTNMNIWEQLGPFSLVISLAGQGITCANKFLCTWVRVGPCRHQAALRTAQVMCSVKKKCCHSESPFLLKAVTDKISSYLRTKQDILEVCNWKRHEREGISVLHSDVAGCVCAVLRSQWQRARLPPFVSPLPSAVGAGWNLKLPVPVHRGVLCCWGLQPKVVLRGMAALGLSPW